MRLSNFLISTTKEVPADAEVISHKMMLRAGFIRKLAAGLYTWSPLGLRTLKKVESIVREEMNNAGALELLMPAVQPAELWQESTRWEQYGPELLRLNDRHNREFCVGPTHEEVITDFVRREVKSYKQLPLNFYQIQTKFRDEIRPRFGIMRAREFLMKDSYSFHLGQDSLSETYQVMHDTYCRIFDRIGLAYRPVAADTGSIGGAVSHEFHVLAESGEDDIAFAENSDYAANVELAEAVALPAPECAATAFEKVPTPDTKSIDDVAKLFDVAPEQCIKTLLVKAEEEGLVALALRGDHTLNDIKAEKLDGVHAPLTMATDEEIKSTLGCEAGSIGVCDLKIPLFVDRSAAALPQFICGGNETDTHIKGASWQDHVGEHTVADIRNVESGDPSPDGSGPLSIARGIEVGHIFQLGKKYSEALSATVLDENGKAAVMEMGCYGIGVSRVVAAAVEQNNDDRGIIWPESIAPFTVAVAPLNMQKSDEVREVATSIYDTLKANGVDVVLDDRNLRPGAMFADQELIGIPHRIVVGDRALKENQLEYKGRRDEEATMVDKDGIIEFILSKLS